MLEVHKIAIPPLTGKRMRRKLYIYIPDEALEDPAARFPVLYMFDGHNIFDDEEATYGKSWGMREYMDDTGTPMIIVGVECNHSPKNGRLSEYSPYSFQDEKFGFVFGRGKLTMDWFTQELKPMIDARYPTLPEREHTFIAGSSMGGLMALYALMEYNHVYGRGAALSPSLWVSPKKISRMIREADIAPDTVLYMDYGAREFANHPAMQSIYTNIMTHLMERNVLLTSRIIPNGDHCEECWQQEVPYFVNALLYERD